MIAYLLCNVDFLADELSVDKYLSTYLYKVAGGFPCTAVMIHCMN